MAGNHLREPLDYLYEELPPEQMTEVRQHLAECPECRAQMRIIRETVKLYRQAEHPIAPVGLSARTIKNALEIAKAQQKKPEKTPEKNPETPAAAPVPDPFDDSVPAGPEPARLSPPKATLARSAAFVSQPPVPAADPQSRAAYGDAEFARLKEEVLGEVHRGGWRNWLFHPAWTVAASVIFLCALLIHFSPRMGVKPEAVVHIPVAPESEESARQLRERERLPASTRNLSKTIVPPPPEIPPILQEAAAMNEAIDFAPAVAAPAAAPAARPQPRVRQMEGFVAAPPALAPQPEQAEKKSLRTMTSNAFAVPQAHVMPSLDDAADDNADAAETVEDDAPLADFSSPRSSKMKMKSRVFATPQFPQQKAEDRENNTATARTDAAPVDTPSTPIVVLDGFSPDDVPQIVDRPAPMDTQERVRSLTTLIGMQIASGEFADARQALGILERYDAKAAADLRAFLVAVPEPVQEPSKPKAIIGAPLPEDAPMPVDKPVPPVTRVEPLRPLAPESAIHIEPETAPEPEQWTSSPLPDANEGTAGMTMHIDRSPLGWIEPPEDPPMSTVRVPVPGDAEPEAQKTEPPDAPPLQLELQPQPTSQTPPRDDGPTEQASTIHQEIIPEQAAAQEPPPVPFTDVPTETETHLREPVFLDEPALPLQTLADPRVSVPKVMEPAASPEGFVRVRTGPAQTTWIAVGPESTPIPTPMPTPMPQPAEPVQPAAPVEPTPAVVYAEAPPVYQYLLPAQPVQPVIIAVPQPAPQYYRPARTVESVQTRRRSAAPQPYLKDY